MYRLTRLHNSFSQLCEKLPPKKTMCRVRDITLDSQLQGLCIEVTVLARGEVRTKIWATIKASIIEPTMRVESTITSEVITAGGERKGESMWSRRLTKHRLKQVDAHGCVHATPPSYTTAGVATLKALHSQQRTEP